MSLDLELDRSGSPIFKAVFPHAAHTALLGCDTCHAGLYEPRRGAATITMAQIKAGESCGVCHGKVAFGAEQCARCHSALPGPVAYRVPEPRTPIERARTWEEAAKLLPARGSAPDWVKALADGVIAPRAGADPAAPDRPGMPLDVERVPAGSNAFRAVFPHAAHTAILACESCHTGLFQMQKGASAMSMAQIYAGEGCGACHGKVAFGADQCARCHTGVPPVTEWRPGPARKPIERARAWEEAERLLPVAAGGPDWAKALADGVIAPRAGADPAAPERQVMPLDVIFGPAVPGTHQVLFSHAAHTAVLGCESCHPVIYQMQRGANPVSMARILAGESCGACHGKVAFPVQACGRCHSIIPGGTS
jgi:c(7)-type cytochrome triheme protein